MFNTDKIRAAVIGLGVGAHQAKTLSLNINTELIWLCDINEDRLLQLGSKLDKARLTQNPDEILQDPSIDLICIASYDEAHYHQIIKALDNGKHVYVEKPICLFKEEAKQICKKLEKNKQLHLSSNMVLRTCPLFKKVKASIMSRTMGNIYHIEADYLWGRKQKLISGWRANAETFSIIYGAAIHMVDLTMWLTEKKPLRVQALGNRITTSGTKQKNNDFAVFLLEFEDKMSIKISAHGGCVHPHFHSLKVFGENSTFIHESTGTVWANSSNPNEKLICEHEDYPAKTQRDGALISFIKSLKSSSEKPLISQQEVLDTMSVCFAAEEAVKTGKIVEIQYL